jgi:hypothetical protein
MNIFVQRQKCDPLNRKYKKKYMHTKCNKSQPANNLRWQIARVIQATIADVFSIQRGWSSGFAEPVQAGHCRNTSVASLKSITRRRPSYPGRDAINLPSGQLLFLRRRPLASTTDRFVEVPRWLMPSWVTPGRTLVEHIESASPQESGHVEGMPGFPRKSPVGRSMSIWPSSTMPLSEPRPRSRRSSSRPPTRRRAGQGRTTAKPSSPTRQTTWSTSRTRSLSMSRRPPRSGRRRCWRPSA